MFKFKYILFFILLIILSSCSKKVEEVKNIKKQSQELEMITVYNEAFEKLEINDTYNAAQKFLEAELLFPQSDWAPKSALMASYSYYLQNYYQEALSNLNRYLKTYPNDKDISYANYLIGICYYEMIEDEKRDIGPILKAKKQFKIIIDKYPNTDFALDATYKLNLIQDYLASKEMYIGVYYIKKKKWIAAINRFKNVVEKYDETSFIDEALHRLVELHYKLGLIEESKKYASLLGYNYQSSEWYSKSYKIFNENYKSKLEIKKEKEGIFQKFKKLLY